MRQRFFFVVCGLLGLSGCASASARQTKGFIVMPVPSEVIGVLQPKLVSQKGQLELVGSVYKKAGGPPTGATHHDVVFLDKAGSTLAVKTVQFEPRVLRRSRPPAGRGHYRLALGELPLGTVPIQVRTHEAPEHSA